MREDILRLQMMLRAEGRYRGLLDGDYGTGTKTALRSMLAGGPKTPLTQQDYVQSAERLQVEVASIKAVVAVESSGSGFSALGPMILPEPHRFHAATGGRFAQQNPDVSYPEWDRTKYPKEQTARYDQLIKMIGLDVSAGLKSASYGKFQILGENYAACGAVTPVEFVWLNCYDEVLQLLAFEKFITKTGLDKLMRSKNWPLFAKGYNGSRYAENNYDVRLSAAYEKNK